MAQQEEDQLGLLPAMSMGPSGYVPPMVASLGSGLAGVASQQMALQQQLDQKEEQRRKEREQKAQERGKLMLEAGKSVRDADMAARGLGLQFGAELIKPEAFKQSFERETQTEAQDQLLKLLGLKGLTTPSAQALIESYRPRLSPAMQGVQLDIQPDLPQKRAATMRELKGAEDRASSLLRNNLISQDEFNRVSNAIANLRTGVSAAADAEAMDSLMATGRTNLLLKTRTPSKQKFRVGNGLLIKYEERIDPATGNTVVVELSREDQSMNAARRAALGLAGERLAIAKQNLKLAGQRLGLATDAADRADATSVLAVLRAVDPVFRNERGAYNEATKRAKARLAQKHSAGLNSINPVEKARANAAVDEELPVAIEEELSTMGQNALSVENLTKNPAAVKYLRSFLKSKTALPAAKAARGAAGARPVGGRVPVPPAPAGRPTVKITIPAFKPRG